MFLFHIALIKYTNPPCQWAAFQVNEGIEHAFILSACFGFTLEEIFGFDKRKRGRSVSPDNRPSLRRVESNNSDLYPIINALIVKFFEIKKGRSQ